MALTAKKVYAILKRQISDMEAKLNSPVRYRGTVATADLLPLNPDIGDMYNIESKSVYGEAGMNVAWNGVVWDTMGAPIDMSLYFTKEEAEAVIQRLVTEYFEKNPVKPGATTEQAQQIEQNKTDIASLKTETSSLKEDINKLISYEQTEQTIRVSGKTVSGGKFDTLKSGGYWGTNGKWIENDVYISYGFGAAKSDYELFIPSKVELLLYIFNGKPSENTFVRRIDSNFPTENKKLIISKGQQVEFCTTDSTGFTVTANNKFVEVNGKLLEENLDKIQKDIGNLQEATETVNTAFPSVEKTNTINITKNMMRFIGNKYPNATGGLADNNGYHAYTYVVTHDGKLSVSNLGNSSFGYLAVYNNSVSDGNLVSDRMESANTVPFFQPINVTKGQIVLLSVSLTTDSESDVEVTSNTTLTYTYNDRPTMFMREMKIAWFGDSISQLQLLPHRVAEYMGITVNDCSFAGANLSIAGTTSDMSVLEISKMIVSRDWTRLENYLSAQQEQGIDISGKRINADTLKNLDFSKITDIVIMIGTNDLNNDYVTTSLSLEVFKQSMRTIIDNINTTYKNINIYFISNPYRGDITPSKPDKHGHSLEDIIKAEQEVANEYNIPYYDLYHNSGINANTIGYYLTNDKLHQNENGDILMAKKITKWLMSN